MQTVEMVGRLLVSLAAVLGLMWFIARKMGKRTGAGKSTRVVEVLGRQSLSRSASVAVVRVMDQALIIGVTDGQVNLIGETELGSVLASVAASGPAGKRRPPAARPKTVRVPVKTAPVASGPVNADAEVPARGALAGSALSPATWRQTVDALRDITVRTK